MAGEAKWEHIDSAPKAISKNEPVLVLVPSGVVDGWNLVGAYKTEHNGWKAFENDKELSGVSRWTRIPLPLPKWPPN